MNKTSTGTLLLLCVIGTLTNAYKPILIMHGLGGDFAGYEFLVEYLKQQRPNTPVIFLETFSGWESIINALPAQLNGLRMTIEQAKAQYNFTDHHLVCHSQGGLLCRAYLQSTNHSCHSFVSLSGYRNVSNLTSFRVHMGEFGATGLVEEYLPFLRGVSRYVLWKLFYRPIAQQILSLANFWNDPFQHQKFKEQSIFLPLYNEYSPFTSPTFRTNFLKLKKAVFTGSPADEIIEPYQSALFSFWNTSSTFGVYSMIDMKDQPIYQQDTFGLKTMTLAGRAEFHCVDNVRHADWHKNATLIDKYVLPYMD